MFDAWAGGRSDEARRIYLELLPLFDVIMGVTTSPIPVKAALGMIGIEVGDPRLPLVRATEPETNAIRAALERTGLL